MCHAKLLKHMPKYSHGTMMPWTRCSMKLSMLCVSNGMLLRFQALEAQAAVAGLGAPPRVPGARRCGGGGGMSSDLKRLRTSSATGNPEPTTWVSRSAPYRTRTVWSGDSTHRQNSASISWTLSDRARESDPK